MARSIRKKLYSRKIRPNNYRPPYTSSHPRQVKVTYMEGFGPEGKLNTEEKSDG